MTTAQVFIDAPSLTSILTYPTLIHHLKTCLPTHSPTLHTPLRHTHSLSSSLSSSLLLMPSWSSSPHLPYAGVKVATHFPHNTRHSLPGIHACFLLFSASSGAPLASLDATLLTLLRTASVSALAASLLSNPHPSTLTLLGAGSLAPHLIRAHLSVRPSIKSVLIWNRTAAKAADLAAALRRDEEGDVEFAAVGEEGLDAAVGASDVISCATNSEAALVRGQCLKAGAHLDLVGSFKPCMRECDDEAMRVGRVFVDNWAAVEEAGEVVGALERGVISKDEIRGSLLDLIQGKCEGRRSCEEITVFKKCVQHWCNEKGDTICEICHQTYQPEYTAPPPPASDDTAIDIGGGWTLSGTPLDLHDPRLLAMAEAERRFLEAEYDEYAATNATGAAFCRSAALILMALLLMRHALNVTDADGDDETSTFFSLFLLRAAGFLLPCYIMAWAISILQRRRQRQEAAALAATQVAFVLQSGQGRGLHFTIASEPQSPPPPPATTQEPA